MGRIAKQVGVLAVVVGALLLSPGAASAEVPPLFAQFPQDPATAGPGADQLNAPLGVAGDATSGHVYVADVNNHRVVEFTAWGEFVKAWGWDVAPGAVDEEQELKIRASAGQFMLSFGPDTTADLDFDASAEEVEAALNGLPSIEAGGGSVSVSGGPGSEKGVAPYLVSFNGGPLAGTDLASLSGADGTTPLSGGDPSSGVEVLTRVNGTPSGAGLEACTAASGCQKGLAGSGSGQLNTPTGMAIDGSGAIFVVDLANRRVQKFDREGHFVVMFGGKVNKTKVEALAPAAQQNRCPVDPGDVCQAGSVGTGAGEFQWGFTGNDFIDVDPDEPIILVGDLNRVQEFNPDGSFKGQIAPLPEARPVGALAVNQKNGTIYITLLENFEFTKEAPFIYKRTGSEWQKFANLADPEAKPFAIKGHGDALAVDSATGRVYALAPHIQTGQQNWTELVGFDAVGQCLATLCPGDRALEPKDGVALKGLGSSLGCGVSPDTLYVAQSGAGKSYLRAYGSPPKGVLCPPPKKAPEITAQYTVSADMVGATVRAAINPKFWPDARYYVEYGTEECSKGGCATKPAPPGALLGKEVGFPTNTVGVFLGDLQPGTTYHYRFVAESGGGGPVFGTDPDGEGPGEASFAAGKEETFTTFPAPYPLKECAANQQFRTGFSAFLPDCRAHEMVSPLDKEGGDIAVLDNLYNQPSRTDQSSLGGDEFTYSAHRAFGEPPSAPFSSQYMATRGEDGWSSEGISPPREGLALLGANHGLDVQYKFFSPDLCKGWLVQESEPVLDPPAPPGFANLYRRELCAGDSYEALNTVEPQNSSPELFEPELQGVSDDGSHTVFRVNEELTEGASASGKNQVYLAAGGKLHLVSVLPDGTPSAKHNSAGTASGRNPNHDHSLWRALSANGKRVYWTTSDQVDFAVGTLYVRENADQPKSEECTGPEKACTYAVSETVSSANAQFWGANADGSLALFSVAGGLYEFDFASKSSTLIAAGAQGVLGFSEDLSRVYFASSEVLSGETQNSEGGKAQAGKPNLYLYEGGNFSFIATLASGDLPINGPSPLTPSPGEHTARVSPNGSHAAFTSLAAPTGYDNADINSGQADAEVFLYDAGAGELDCISCDPSGARPVGRDIDGIGTFPGGKTFWAAAAIVPWPSQLYSSRALSDNGSRLFFESYGPLVLRDTNGKRDVYEWERASGKEACEALGAELFVASAGGCISLISSGESPEDSEFLDATPTGSDVFFATESSLLTQDYGLIDIYDARVGGGFPPPPVPVPPCEGEACQSPPPPPDDPTPSSSAFQDPGNVVEPPARPRCGKGKVRRKGRCVSKKNKRAKRSAKHKRRAQR